MIFPWTKRTGSPVDMTEALRALPLMKRARIDVKSKSKAVNKLIIGIGQIHPVHKGKFSRSAARKIGSVQGWIHDCCLYCYDTMGVRSFGQEGFSGQAGAILKARMDPRTIAELEQAVRMEGSVRSVLLKVADKWQMALKLHNEKDISKNATALNGLGLLQAMKPDVSMFPIEQKDVHGRIGEGIAKLQDEMARIEASKEYKSVQYKKGKGLTKPEYNSIMRRNALVKAFNKALKHPERNRSIFREVVEFSEQHDITVFVLGQAHRGGILTLANRHLPEGTLFVWITPKELWWWKAMMGRVVWISAITTLIASALYVFS